MKSSTPWVAVLFVLACVSTLAPAELTASDAPASVKARSFLASLGERAIELGRDKTSAREDQESRMRALLREGFDLKVLARVVVGKHWRKLDKGQREDFVELFQDAMVQQTLTAFGRYRGETFDITGVGADATNRKLIEVSMDVMRSTGTLLAKVNWRIRKEGEDIKVVDIVVEGDSLSVRQKYGAVIERSQGKVDALTEVPQ